MKIRRKVLGLSALVATLMALFAVVPAFAAIAQNEVKVLTTELKTDDGPTVDGARVFQSLKFALKDTGLNTTVQETIYVNLTQFNEAVANATATTIAITAAEATAGTKTISLPAALQIKDTDGNDGCTDEQVAAYWVDSANVGAVGLDPTVDDGGAPAALLAIILANVEVTDCRTVKVPEGNDAWAESDVILLSYAGAAVKATAGADDVAPQANAVLTTEDINLRARSLGGILEGAWISSSAVTDAATTLVSVDRVEDNAGNVYQSPQSNPSAMTLRLSAQLPVSDWVAITVTYNKIDTHASRVKVTSTSDPTGEWVSVSEKASEAADAAGASDTGIFQGAVNVASTADSVVDTGRIWVQNNDVVTISYYGPSGSTVVATATVTADGAAPTVVVTAPGDDVITNSTIPIITFTVADSLTGFNAAAPSSYVNLQICDAATVADATDCYNATGSIAFTASASKEISGIFSASASWLTLNGNEANAAGGKGAGAVATNENESFYILTLTDKAGNSKAYSYGVTIDTVKPVLTANIAKTGSDCVSDSPKTNVRNSIVVSLTDNGGLDLATITADDFTIGGVAAASIKVPSASADCGVAAQGIYLTTATTIASNATPEVKIVGEIKDKAGNKLDLAGTVTQTATDGLAPVISDVSISNTLLSDISKITTSVVTFSVDETVNTKLVLVSDGAGTDNIAIVETAPKSYKATIDSSTLEDGLRGVTIYVEDASGNGDFYGDASQKDEFSPVATNGADDFEFTLKNASILAADKQAGGAEGVDDFTIKVDGVDATANCVGAAISATGIFSFTDVADANDNAAAQPAECEVTVNSKVTIEYKTTSVKLEVDNALGAITFTPDGTKNVEKKGVTYVTAVVPENKEYTGDSHNGVTITSATLNGDAITMSSADGYTWVFAIPDAPLGTHTLALTAKDDALNPKTGSLTFTIVAKTAYSVSLNPGWNLVSLPGNPVDGSVASVLAGTEADTVISYVNGEWLVSTKASGDWSGTLTTISQGAGYWVQSPAPGTIKTILEDQSATGALPTIAVVKGWNLVGKIDLAQAAQNAGGVKPASYFGSTVESAYTYDTVGGTWTKIDLATNNLDLVNGKGYWVWSKAAGTIVP